MTKQGILRIAVIATALSPVFLFAWFFWQQRSGTPIEFVVPANFKGTIEVIEDSDNGEELKFIQGKYVFIVPATGVMRVNNTAPFSHWHEETCRESNGRGRALEQHGTGQGSLNGGLKTFFWEVK